MQKFSLKFILFVASSAILAIGSSLTPAQAQSVSRISGSASDLGTQPIEISTLAPTVPSVPTASTPAVSHSMSGNPDLVDSMLSSQSPSAESAQPSPGATTPVLVQPEQSSTTGPTSSDRNLNRSSPLDLSPASPGRSDPIGRSVEPPDEMQMAGRATHLKSDDRQLSDSMVLDPMVSPETQPSESTVWNETPDPSLDNQATTPDGSAIESSSDTTTQDPSIGQAPVEDPFTPEIEDISPGRATRSGPSYIGVGGNIGLGSGDTALGEGSFSVFSKVGLTRNLSVRPAVMISDDPTILLPVTLDLIPLVTDATENVSEQLGLRVSPYIGAGAAFSTGDEFEVDFLATAGVDVPITSRFTATAAVNASLFDNPAVGLMLGVGYNF